MNKSLKFLAIGLALAVLLVSQVGVDRSTEAAPIEGTNDMVEFAGPAGTDDAAEQQDFYRPGVTADFYLKDPDLALPTNTATITFTVPDGGDIGTGALRLRVAPALHGTLNTPSGDYAPGHEGTATTTAEGEFGAGRDLTTPGSTIVTYTVNDHWAAYMGDASTPIDGRPTITVRSAATGNGERFVTIYDPDTGAISEFVGAAISGRNADDDPDNNPATDDGYATTTVTVSFKYHVSDVFTVNQRAGTTAGPDQNRAKVTSSSDGVGEWVKITEVAAIGSTTPHPTSNIYHGSIYLESDSAKASRNDEEIGVRDGDTLTVTFYEEDQITEVDSDTATIDGEKPAILSVSPGDKTVTDRSSPVVTVTVADAGSGFDTSFPREHVDISIMDGDDVCRIPDARLTATRLNSGEIDILFRNTGSWVSGGTGINCDQIEDPTPTDDDPMAMTPRSTIANYQADSKSIDAGKNNHGTQFTINVVTRDVAGNMNDKMVKLTIDTEAPSIAEGSTTGVNWDAKKSKEVADRSAIKVVFNEALDASTVDVSDFIVENPDASIESLQVAGADAANADSKNEVVYLQLSSDLASDARPRVELDGSIMDKAGNELKSTAVARVEDGIKPGITVDAFSAQLLAKDGESAVTFSADENLAANTAAVASEECTCLSITGGSGVDADRGDVNLPTPSEGTYTFKAGSTTGIYGVLVQASDVRAQVTREGATKVTDETTKAMDVSGGEMELTPHDEDAEVEATTTIARFSVTVSLAKWPLADANFSISLDDDVAIKGADDFEKDGNAFTGSKVTEIEWEAGTVTLELTYSDEDTELADDDELMATYHYVAAEQTVEVDLDAPTATFMPDGDTQSARPFIRIQWDESEYAGDTNTTVTVTSATLSGPDDFEMELVNDEMDLLHSTDWKLYSYLPDSDLALGEYTITAVGRDAAGNVSETQSGTFKVVPRPPVSITLNLGWNLISLPAEPADTSIDAVINVDEVTQVLTYDPTVEGGWLAAVRVNGAFEGGLTNIDATKSYLVYTTSVAPLKVDIPGLAQGTTEFPPAIQLHAGWNMVPASSLNPDDDLPRDIDSYLSGVKWSRGYYYDTDGRLKGFIPGETDDDELVALGRGFLIYVTADSTLVP